MIPINTSNTRKNVLFEATVNFKQVNKVYCSYSHSVLYSDGETVMFVGACLFRNVLEGMDARKNSAWREHVSDMDNVILRVPALFENMHEAQNNAAIMIREMKPFCNIYGSRTGNGGPIRNINEDRSFSSASEACKYYGIAASTLSNHLNNRSGYRTIRGMTFERV